MSNPNAAPRTVACRVGGAWLISVRGVIDERFNDDFIAQLEGDPAPAVIDLDGVVRITSFGVREWMRVLRRLPSSSYFFVRCRPTIVAQLNSVAQFGGTGQVITFYSPYACPKCGQDFEVLVDLRKTPDVVAKRLPQSEKCPRCGSAAEFDDVEDSYFAAIAQQPALALPLDIDAAIDGGVDVRLPLRLSKTVVEDVTGLWLQGELDKRARLKRTASELEGDVVLFLRDCSVADEDGLARLREIVDAESVRVHLVAVPLAIAHALAEAGALTRAALLSLSVPTRCSACRAIAVVDPALLTVQCRACGVAFRPVFSPAQAAAVATLPVKPSSPRIAAFIAAHPTPRRASSGTPPDGVRVHSAEGTRIGRYEIIKRIGQGGMAEILLGRQFGPQGFEKKVVIKRILPQLASQSHFVDMFLQEARLAARLGHSNIVQIFDLGRDGDDYFIVMEYVAGSDLNGAIRISRRLQQKIPPEICARIIADVCGGLHAAHTHRRDDGTRTPILHRDVSPHNVMLGLDGAVKLADFGVAKAADSVTNTESGMMKGKLVYMAPEQVNGAPPEPRMDIYAAGLMLYVSLADFHPFHKKTDLESMSAILRGVRPTISEVRPDVPPGLAAIVERALAPNLADRFQTAEQFQMALERYLGHVATPSSNADLGRWLRTLLTAARDAQLQARKAEQLVVVVQDNAKSTDRTQVAKPQVNPEEGTPMLNYLDD